PPCSNPAVGTSWLAPPPPPPRSPTRFCQTRADRVIPSQSGPLSPLPRQTELHGPAYLLVRSLRPPPAVPPLSATPILSRLPLSRGSLLPWPVAPLAPARSKDTRPPTRGIPGSTKP